jgi:DNA-binding PadR family transcriptional regulator
MSLEHAILGFLQYQPFTGYDLKKAFDASVQHFWPADQSQIYRTLARMAEQGWVELEVMRGVDRPDRKVYRITDAGRAELRRWLQTPLPLEPHRSADLVRVFFAGQLSDEEALAIFETEATRTRQVLQAYGMVAELAQPYVDAYGDDREHFFWFLTLEAGQRNAEAHLAWLESVIERIRRGEQRSRGAEEQESQATG